MAFSLLNFINNQTLSGLSDVDLTGVVPGDTMVLGTEGQWVPIQLSTAGGVTSTPTTQITVPVNTSYSGDAGDEAANGGLLLDKPFQLQNGSTSPAYSQSIQFGPNGVAGTLRLIAIQTSNDPYGTILVIQRFDGAAWITILQLV